MKLLHTSDWHLGQSLYNYSRSDEEVHFFKQLAAVVQEEQPDAMLVSGDIFHTGTPGNEVARCYTDGLLEVCNACPSMEVIVIAGNHDSYSRLTIDEKLWKFRRVHVIGEPPRKTDGTADFSKAIIDIQGKALVAAVPYCHKSHFPRIDEEDHEDAQQAYFAGLQSAVNQVNASHLPMVLMAHLAAGREVDFTGHDSKEIVGGEECVDVSTLGSDYDYIALGHIHCPQWLRGEKKVARYCGTPRQIHFDETHPHGVDIVDVVAGQPPTVSTLLLPPLRTLVTIGGENGLPFDDALTEFTQLEPFSKETYVRLNIRLAAKEYENPEWKTKAQQAISLRGGRFCTLNPIREKSIEEDTSEVSPLTMTELKEMTPEDALEILTFHKLLSDRQRELLRGVLQENLK